MNSAVQNILQKKSIVKYLESKNVVPYKVMGGGRIAYLCPFPDHSEKKPSFYVWTNGEYENFYCFGCQRHHNIIHLVSAMEGLSYKDAFQQLNEGIEIGLLEAHDLAVERNKNDNGDVINKLGLSTALNDIASLCQLYLREVGNDPVERGIIDSLYAAVDRELSNFEFAELEETLLHLPEMLIRRREKFENLKLERLAAKYASREHDLAQS